MKRTTLAFAGLLTAAVITTGAISPRLVGTGEAAATAPTKLGVLWTSGDRDVALKMVFMYMSYIRANHWWDDARVIVWGPSSKLLPEDEELQETIRSLMDMGFEVVACKACADLYGVSEKLESLGIEVKYAGGTLTEMLKSDEWATVTF